MEIEIEYDFKYSLSGGGPNIFVEFCALLWHKASWEHGSVTIFSVAFSKVTTEVKTPVAAIFSVIVYC